MGDTGSVGLIKAIFSVFLAPTRIRELKSDLETHKDKVLYRDTFDEFKAGLDKRLETIESTTKDILNEVRK